MRRRLAWTAALTTTVLLTSSLQSVEAPPAAAAATPTVSYTYDRAGRLKTVTDPTGASATYGYDAVGNLTGITRATAPAAARGAAKESAPAAPARPAITRVSWGARTVTVYGRNFQPDPALDTVKVDGLFARVTAATGTRLDVTIPPGAHDHRGVRVSTPAGSVTVGPGRPAAPAGPPPTAPGRPTADGRSALTGRVLDNRGPALAGVRLRIDEVSTVTDGNGRFTLTGLPAGHHELMIDGSAATSGDHGRFEQGVDLPAGRLTTLPWTTYLPLIDNAHAVRIPAVVKSRTEVRSPAIPGLRVILPAGTRIVDEDGKPVRRLSVTRMPLERQPFPGAPGMPLAWTIQPGGAVVKGPGLQVVYPNVAKQPPGTHIDYVDNDADRPGQGWAVYGGGRVSGNGRSIVPDATTRLHETYLLGVTYSPPCLLKIFCPAPGEDSADGDPVNLSTGLLMMSRTDLALPDVDPIALTRSYRQSDRVVRSFGIGQSDEFNLFMAPDQAGNYVLGMPGGRSVRFAPGTDGTYRAVATPTEFTGAVLSTDNHTNFRVTLRSGTVYTFGSHNASLIEIADRYGNVTTLDRDPNGTLRQVTSPNGRWLALTWSPCAGGSSCITKVSDNIGRSVRYTYDDSGRMTTAVDPSGGVTSYVWAPCSDDAHCTQLTAVTDPRGIQYLRNVYDANGRVASQTQADGGVYRFAYTLDSAGAVTATAVTDPVGVVHRTVFNTAGYAVSDTAAYGSALAQTSTVTRDATTNRVTAATDPTGRRSTYTYDADGNVLSSTRLAGTADAVTTGYTYEPRYGRLATARNALGLTSSFTYDDDNDIITATDPLGRRASTTMLSGQPVAITDARGKTSHISYLDGDPVAVADALGRVSTAYYDGAGRPIRRADPLQNTVRLSYDVLNQLTRVVDPLGAATTSTYDANGGQLTLTDANGHTTRWAYDRMGNPLTRTDALNRVSSATYDLLGRLVSTTDAKGVVSRASYDALGRPTTAGYGAAVSGGTTTYRSTITTGYDTANRPTTIADSTGGTLTQAYDTLDRLTRQTSPKGTVTYTYDKADRRTSMTVTGQAAVTYAYDNGDQLTSITQGTAVTRFGYDANERRTSLTLPNGVVTGYGYDDAGQLLGLTYTSGTTTLGTLAYGYDPAGRRVTVSGSYARVTLPTAMSGATYDAANQLTKLGTTTFGYDANGQLTGDGSATYAWNDRHQLTGIAGPTTAAFAYDALGRRATRTVGTTTTGYLYDGDNAVQELAGSTPQANMITGLTVDETYQRTDAGGVHHPLADALGSTLAQTAGNAGIQNTYTYEPFGKTSTAGAASTNSSQFTGRENDGTGLYYYRARYYSPTAQRFISADPAGEAASGTNLYAYVDNSPTNYTDPSGEQLLPGCIGGALFEVGSSWAINALTGRKYTWQQGAKDAALGCAMGATGAWLGEAFAAAKAYNAESKLARAAENCLTHSFDARTPVVMADGSSKPIEEVRVGDRVRTTDPDTGRTVVGKVSHVFRNHDTDLTDVRVEDRRGRTSVLHTTSRHRFYDDTGHTWVEAGELTAGTRLHTPDRDAATVAGVTSRDGAQVMYDLTVDDVHTYYVVAGGMSVLVHNTSCPLPGSRPGKPFTPGEKKAVWDENAATHSGTNTCEICGTDVVKPLKSERGVTPPTNEGQVDHVIAKSNGGSGDRSNGQLLCRVCNRAKWDD